jgi:hypothetical protein
MAVWTEERRKKQAEAIKRWKPWEKSTGPKTRQGKSRTRMNAYNYGGKLGDEQRLNEMARLNREFTKACYKMALAELAKNQLLETKQNQRGRAPPPAEGDRTDY